jgi:MFS family permease
VVVLLGLLVGGAGASMVVGTVLVQSTLHSVTKDLGFLSLWFGVGLFLGTVAHGRWGTAWPKRRSLGTAFMGCAVSVWFFLAAVLMLKSGVAASFSTALLGFFVAPVGIVTNTLVHEAHPERLHGRIFSSMGVVFNLSLILSMLAAGWLTDRGGRGLLLGAIGSAFAAAGAALLAKHDIVWAPGLRPGAHKES